MIMISKSANLARSPLLYAFEKLLVVASSTALVTCMILFSGEVSGSELVPTALDIVSLRPMMPGEGLLAHVANPYAQNATAPVRSGEEFTGWIDVRHPALAGAADTLLGFDRYDRQLSQATTILKDKNALAGSDVVTDLKHANTAFARQAGVSIIERS